MRHLLLIALLCVGSPVGLAAVETAPAFTWQRDYAVMKPNGDIELKQTPFRYQPGTGIRYIDFEGGSDAADGSKGKPWKHHPWDGAFTGQSPTGVDTYVFKSGVVYRGQLDWKEGGSAQRPLLLTSDPGWGKGPAVLAGSRVVTGWKRGADHGQIPDGDKVWVAQLDWVVANLWWVKQDGSSQRIPLAREPNWRGDGVDVTKDWWSWTNDGHPFQPPKGWSAQDSTHLKGKPRDFIEGAYIYSEYGWVMGYPSAALVKGFDPEKGLVAYSPWTGGNGLAGTGAHIINRGHRYFLENKPHYLDDPTGEFWCDRQSRKLYLRLPDGADPNTERIEAGKQTEIIDGKDAKHIRISGLAFRWVQQHPDLDTEMYSFDSKPWGFRSAHHEGAVRFWQNAEDIGISHCTFADVNTGVLGIARDATGTGCRDIEIADCDFINNDASAIFFKGWMGGGLIDELRIYRNHMRHIGYRAPRYFRGTAICLQAPVRSHIAGNVIAGVAGQGINVYGPAGPFSRQLIHQNKVWESMQHGNDYGGIEFWDHGPAYIFDNLSFDARGMVGTSVGKDNGFGHAYYLDGGFKCHLFNNIAWGRSRDPKDPAANCAAFQEIFSYQNQFFNNSAFNYAQGTRRQSPDAGHGKYLGNVWQDVNTAFWHSNPAKNKELNEHHAGRQNSKFDDGTNAYALNFFNGIVDYGTVDSQGRRFKTFGDFRRGLEEIGSMATTLGSEADKALLRDPGKGDWRLATGSPAIDQGARVFVPWAIFDEVAEWNFYPSGCDHTRIFDEHWTRAPYMKGREQYKNMPRWPLTAVNIERSDYVDGPLENYVTGSLRLDPARKQYAVLAHQKLTGPYTVNGNETIVGEQIVNPEIQAQDLFIEVYFKADGDGILVSKRAGSGYDLRLRGGQARFTIAGKDQEAAITSRAKLTDGRWHHLVAEADRAARTIALFIDGKQDGSAAGLGPVSLANDGDLTVGGSATGDHLAGQLEFMRIARGTLAASHTSIEELYAWEFAGPQQRDFAGQAPKGKARDAGAVESF